MDRVNFIESISGIDYPEMIVNFFDHFVALKQIVQDSGTINVLNSDDKFIEFSITFDSNENKDNALSIINSLGGSIVIYGRMISIMVDIPTDRIITIRLS